MKDFNIDKLSRKMPYEVPSDDFFENFTSELLSTVAEEKPQSPKTFWLGRLSSKSMIGIAAAITIALTVSLTAFNNKSQWSYDYTLSDNIAESVDSYLGSLSDEELEYLASEISYTDDFYSNLPNN